MLTKIVHRELMYEVQYSSSYQMSGQGSWLRTMFWQLDLLENCLLWIMLKDLLTILRGKEHFENETYSAEAATLQH